MATLSLTKHFVEVAGQFTDGELRVVRQYISVLTQGVAETTHNESVNNTLALTDSATFDPLPSRTSDDLGITDSLFLNRISNFHISDDLGLTDSVIRIKYASANNTLNLTDEDFSYFNYIWDRKPVSNTLNFVQEVQTLSTLSLDSTLNFVQTLTARNSTIHAGASNHIFLYQYVPKQQHVWLESTLAFEDRIRVPITYTFTQSLNLSQGSSMTGVIDTLVFIDSVVAGIHFPISQTLNFVEVMDVQGDFVRSINDTLGIGHAFTWYEDTPCARKQYTPFYGENTIPGAITPPSHDLPITQVSPMTDRFLLYTPARGPRTTNLVLRAPEPDNRDRNAFSRVARETRGGKFYVFADTSWPRVRTVVVTIVGLLKTDIDSVQAFFQSTLGQEIGMTDWEGRMWVGVVTNPEEPATQDGRDRWTITFSMEGELLDGQYPGSDDSNSLGLTDSVNYELV